MHVKKSKELDDNSPTHETNKGLQCWRLIKKEYKIDLR